MNFQQIEKRSPLYGEGRGGVGLRKNGLPPLAGGGGKPKRPRRNNVRGITRG